MTRVPAAMVREGVGTGLGPPGLLPDSAQRGIEDLRLATQPHPWYLLEGLSFAPGWLVMRVRQRSMPDTQHWAPWSLAIALRLPGADRGHITASPTHSVTRQRPEGAE